jgi:hypothetical protein
MIRKNVKGASEKGYSGIILGSLTRMCEWVKGIQQKDYSGIYWSLG